MRRPWIKIEVSTPDKPEICTIASRLRLDEDAVVGKLVRLWSWAELNAINPNDLGVTKEFLDKLCGKKGFTDALMHAGWLEELDGKLMFPNFARHNGNASKVRGLTARRVELHRHRNAKKNVRRVTKPEPDSVDSHHDQSVPTHSKLLVTKDLDERNTNADQVPEPIPAPIAIEPQPQTPPQPLAAPEAPAEEDEPKARKRRPKVEEEGDLQPMLF